MTAALFLVALLAGPPAPAKVSSEPYDPDARVAYVAQALDAVRATDAKTLVRARGTVSSLAGSTCASQMRRLRLDCLVAASDRFCKTRPRSEAATCPLVMDLAVSGFFAEDELISHDRKLEILRSADFRKKLADEVASAQGAIAADFQLRTGRDAATKPLPERIDRYCQSRTDAAELSWQSCAGSLIWFIGTTDRKGP